MYIHILKVKEKEKKSLKKTKEACDDCGNVNEKMDMADRKNRITEILNTERYPSQDNYNGSVESFANSNLDLETIRSLVRSTVRGFEYQKELTNRPRAGVH